MGNILLINEYERSTNQAFGKSIFSKFSEVNLITAIENVLCPEINGFLHKMALPRHEQGKGHFLAHTASSSPDRGQCNIPSHNSVGCTQMFSLEQRNILLHVHVVQLNSSSPSGHSGYPLQTNLYGIHQF